MMTQRQALEVLVRQRGDKIVLTTMSSAGIWPELSDSPLDFHFIPSAMGLMPDLALGLALAQPQRGVLAINGDGCMLMNLGSLVTLAHHPANVYLVVLDNGIYEVTGGQTTAGAGNANFAELARAAGIGRVYSCDTLERWQAAAGEAMSGAGPVAVSLKVEGRRGQKTPKPVRTLQEQIDRLQKALGLSA
jgi:thiamine pyrophosphate-dependent acetolactate synthase large subunit-like protein